MKWVLGLIILLTLTQCNAKRIAYADDEIQSAEALSANIEALEQELMDDDEQVYDENDENDENDEIEIRANEQYNNAYDENEYENELYDDDEENEYEEDNELYDDDEEENELYEEDDELYDEAADEEYEDDENEYEDEEYEDENEYEDEDEYELADLDDNDEDDDEEDEEIDYWGDLYENANDFYFDNDEQESDDDDDIQQDADYYLNLDDMELNNENNIENQDDLFIFDQGDYNNDQYDDEYDDHNDEDYYSDENYENSENNYAQYNDDYNDNDDAEIADFQIDDRELQAFYKQFADAYYSDTGDEQIWDDIAMDEQDQQQQYDDQTMLNDYFDELDEFYYNNFRLHNTYNDFKDIDFSQVLSNQYNSDENEINNEIDYDSMNFEQLLDALNEEEWPSLKRLKQKFKDFKKKGKTFIDKHIQKGKAFMNKMKPKAQNTLSKTKQQTRKRMKKKIMNKVKNTLKKWKNKFKILKRRVKAKLRRRAAPATPGKKKQAKPMKKVGSFIKKHGKSGLKKLARAPQVVRGVLRSFMFYLRSAAQIKRKKKGNKYGLNPLDPKLVTFLQPYFSGIHLSKIKVAMSVNTLNGQAVTIGYDIFFPTVLDFKDNQADLAALIRQIQLALRCKKDGGVWPFLRKEVVLKGGKKECEKIIETRALNIWDMEGLRQDADDKAEKCIRTVWQQYGNINAIVSNGQP